MREISDLEIYLSLTPEQLASTILHCPECGRDHKIPFKIVKSGQDLIKWVPMVIEKILTRRSRLAGVVYDRQIEEKVSRFFSEPLQESGLNFAKIPLGDKGRLLPPSVEMGDDAAEKLSDDIDILIGIGSGVISDLTKWIATKRSLPFMLVGSAASMNAYTSITATMTEEKVKTSRWLDPASAVLLDTDLLASAPQEMTCAGIGDLLARNISNADWKLSEKIRGTYFCPVAYHMMARYQDRFLADLDPLSENHTRVMASLGDAVLVSGYSMTVLDGETSPSSGSEHILSHFFDFQHEVFDFPRNLHGTQVGIGTLIMSAAFDLLKAMNPSAFDLDEIERRRLSTAAVKLDHRRVFGENGKKFDRVVAEKRVPDVQYRQYVSAILNAWQDIWADVEPYLMPASKIRKVMESTGAETKLSGINRTAESAVQALLYGSHYRPRYTILDLMWELGLFPGFAPEILARAGVLD